MSRGLWFALSARTRRTVVLLWTALFLCSIAMQSVQLAVPTPVLATPPGASVFQLEGNAVDDGAGEDWINVWNDSDDSAGVDVLRPTRPAGASPTGPRTRSTSRATAGISRASRTRTTSSTPTPRSTTRAAIRRSSSASTASPTTAMPASASGSSRADRPQRRTAIVHRHPHERRPVRRLRLRRRRRRLDDRLSAGRTAGSTRSSPASTASRRRRSRTCAPLANEDTEDAPVGLHPEAGRGRLVPERLVLRGRPHL